MNSYNKLKKKNEDLTKEVELLKKQLFNKGAIFFKSKEWLGVGRTLYGVILEDGNHRVLNGEPLN